ncbi:hypothetical protein BK126_11580 [Paenibacillus sp. FSL H7-0326]|uniref:hypothetical protein n=1 Tax=Paenibacillus sp. FSL H7-0326 TaxID=1921144 RepID=UPI00096EDBF5|nr:hypothetical protein [Paenibacillus sp. FSL H7-0326]OMC68470.1 hypothetical protein BK126_11580 [Paenibacillus sp. FSL H7-0326]
MVVDPDILVRANNMDSLIKSIEVSCAHEDWEEVITLSQALLHAAELVHFDIVHRNGPTNVYNKHIIYYFAYSHLMSSLSYQKLKQYSESIKYISYYSELSWLSDGTKAGEAVIEKFKSFAAAHLLTLEILRGNMSKLPEYEAYLENYSGNALLIGLSILLESAIEHGYCIDRQLLRFKQNINSYDYYAERNMASQYLSYQYLLAQYEQLNDQHSEALCTAVYTLWAADRLNNDNYFKKAIHLFESLRKNASVSQLTACFNQPFY